LIVLDASAAICLLLNSPVRRASALRSRLQGEHVQAPHLIDLEVAHTLRRYVLTGTLAPGNAHTALADLLQFPLIRHPHYPFLNEIWRLHSNVTAYDAAYVTLARFLGVPLITLDARLARVGTGAVIEVF